MTVVPAFAGTTSKFLRPCRLKRFSSVILTARDVRKREGKAMGKVRAAAFSVSLDGYGAGAAQDVNNPLGIGGEQLHSWMVKTQMFHKMTGREGGATGIDDDFAEASM